MEVLDPVGSAATASRALAKRPATLSGLVIGILDNSKPNARVLLDRVAVGLVERMGARAIRAWGKPGAAAGASAAVLDEIASACAVTLTASAD